MKSKALLFSVLMLVCLLNSCKVNRPDGVLSPRQMERLLYDYHMAQAFSEELPVSEKYTTPAMMDWAFAKHGVDKETFESSLVWYTRYPKEFAKIYKKLNLRISDEYKLSSDALSRLEHKAFHVDSGDSVSLWYLNRTAILNASAYMNRLSLSLSGDSTFHLGDTLQWDAKLTFSSGADSAGQGIYSSLSVWYGDSVCSADTLIFGPGSAHLRLLVVLDTATTMSSVRFQTHYIDTVRDRSSVAVLTGMDLVRYHMRQLPQAPAELGADDGSGNGDIE